MNYRNERNELAEIVAAVAAKVVGVHFAVATGGTVLCSDLTGCVSRTERGTNK